VPPGGPPLLHLQPHHASLVRDRRHTPLWVWGGTGGALLNAPASRGIPKCGITYHCNAIETRAEGWPRAADSA
jgi:hypothetical protein